MVWERIKRISDAEPVTGAGGEPLQARLDRPPPAAWEKLFQSNSGPHLEMASRVAGQEVSLGAGQTETEGALSDIDARIAHTNLLYESEILSPAVIELLEELGARDPGDLVIRFANTAGQGTDRDREEAERAAHEFSNAPALLVENEDTAESQPIDQALCSALLKAGAVDKRS